MDISDDVKGFLYMHLQCRSRFLGHLTRSICLNFPPFFVPFSPSSPSNVVVFAPCALYPVLNVYPNIVWRGEGRAIRGIQTVTEVHMMLHLHIYIFDMLGIWKEGFQ